MMFTRKILVVDDEPIIRTLLAERLAQSGFECFTAADALSAKRVMLKEEPDALVVDLDLGDGPSGTELIAALTEMDPSLGFVLLTNYTPTQAELKASGNLVYLSKREVSDVNLVVAALESVLRKNAQAPSKLEPSKLSGLTKLQLETLGLLARGLTNAEIAQRRQVGIRAVEQSIHRIYVALGLTREAGKSARVSAARLYSNELGPRRGGF